MYTIEFSRPARKQLRDIPKTYQKRIASKFSILEKNPRSPGVKKLAQKQDLYRVRVGDYHIVYEIFDSKLLIQIIRIAHRRLVYQDQ